ncbi:TolC family protein [Arsenicibacter rosenii]|uniref:Transporter n=1 Tax=Arsenicibacter rosenii TaxID=1750698 RepID=A0A1S2VNE1_9BACT|nr:TolC family protein [Arsenicibacter rosenii]OIN59725.1 hypothetical protein BLX24_07635 [Arsenicibacter rosenii]
MVRLLALCILYSLTAQGQTVVTSVQEALALAQNRNPDLQNSLQNRQLQDQQKTVARAARLPQARVYANFDYNYALPTQLLPAEFLGGKPGEFQKIQFGVPYVFTPTAEVTMPLINRPARVDLAITDQNLKILDDQKLVLQDDISTQTARIYHATLLARAAIQITGRNLSSADTLVQIARDRLDKGLIEPLEYNRIRSVQLTTADVLQQNELIYGRNLNQLKVLLGLTVADSLVLTESLLQPAMTPEGPVAGMWPKRPQITLKESQLALYRLQLDREKAMRWPTLSAYGRFAEQAQRKQFDFFNLNQPWYAVGVAGLQFNLPLYSGGLRDSNIGRARMRIKLAEAELAYEQIKQDLDQADLQNTYRQAVRSLSLNRQNYELSQQNVQIALVKYRSGLFAYDQYLNVFNDALTAQNRYLNNVSNAFINQTILQIRHGK